MPFRAQLDFQLPDAECWYQRCPDLAGEPGLKYRWRFVCCWGWDGSFMAYLKYISIGYRRYIIIGNLIDFWGWKMGYTHVYLPNGQFKGKIMWQTEHGSIWIPKKLAQENTCPGDMIQNWPPKNGALYVEKIGKIIPKVLSLGCFCKKCIYFPQIFGIF